jgi:hypothetical protein
VIACAKEGAELETPCDRTQAAGKSASERLEREGPTGDKALLFNLLMRTILICDTIFPALALS